MIYDGLSHELLQWKEHIITVLKKCMLLDLSFDSLSTVCVPYAAVPPVFYAAGKIGISSMVIQLLLRRSVIYLTPGGVSFPMSSPFFFIYLCLHENFKFRGTSPFFSSWFLR